MLTHIMENSGLVVVGIAIKAAVSAGVVLANISAKETGTPLPCRGMGWHEKSLSYGIFNDLLRKTPFCIHMASDKGSVFQTQVNLHTQPFGGHIERIDQLILYGHRNCRCLWKIALCLFIQIKEAHYTLIGIGL